MAWYKDPETYTMKEVDLFEKNNSQFPSIKSIQSTMLVVPFNVPYKAYRGGTEKNLYGYATIVSAKRVAQTKSFNCFPVSQIGATVGADEKARQKYWLPWNMNKNNLDGSGDFIASNYYNAVDVLALSDIEALGDWRIVKNQTKFKNNKVFNFRKQASMLTGDPVRLNGKFSFLKETTPIDTGYLQKDVPFSFNSYDIGGTEFFANKNSTFWTQDAFLAGTFSSHIEMHPIGYQHLSNLFLKHEEITVKGSDYTDDNEWNPIIENLINQLGEIDQQYFYSVANQSSYRDATFEIKKPFLERAYESDIGDGMISTSPIKVQGHYNFYLPSYEKAISDYGPTDNEESSITQVKVPLEFNSDVLSPIPEPMIPNIYALVYDQISEEDYFRYSDQGSWMPLAAFKYSKKENGSLNYGGFGKQKEGTATQPANSKFMTEGISQFLSITTKKNHVDEVPVKNIAEYLNSWVSMTEMLNKRVGNTTQAFEKWNASWATVHGGYELASEGIKSAAMLNKEKKYNVVGISAYKIKDLTDEADKLKKMFPFHVDVELPMANSGMVGKLLYDAGLTDIFMQNVMAAMYTIVNDTIPESDGALGTDSLREFYDNYNLFMSTALDDTCVIRKDGPSNLKKSQAPHQDTMFNETLLHLWLNDLLETEFLLDLDAAPAKMGQQVPFAKEFKDVPPQYYDWINSKSAQDYFDQVMKLKGYHPSDAEDKLAGQILKPVVFGKAPPKSSNSPLSLIKWLSTKKKINNFINDNVRSVSDVYAGKKAHSEVLFYEVVKYKSKTGTKFGPYNPGTAGYSEQVKEDPFFSYSPVSGPDVKGLLGTNQKSFIQSFFIPNIPGMDMAKYIDTQVKYDKGYYYQVYAHTLVVGTQYQYSASDKVYQGAAYNHLEGKFHKLTMNCDYKPDVHLIRVPYYNTIAATNETVFIPESKGDTFDKELYTNYNLSSLETSLVWDSPPIFPDAVFLPLYGKKDEILISCNFNIGEHELHPVSLDTTVINNNKFIDKAEELAQIKVRINQRKMKGPVVFSGDDFCGSIEILRIDFKPTSYSDFTPTSDTRIANAGGGKSNFAVYDKIEPNKDYYYILREVDVHGNHSNPSPVYMARIVHKDGEAPYTIFKMFFMEELQGTKPDFTKSFMKYIKIQPSLEQRVINDLEIGDFNSEDLLQNTEKLDYVIGELNLSKNVWGKKFKFRFTSKKTGKKFDLNLDVKNVNKIEKEIGTTPGEPDTYSLGKC